MRKRPNVGGEARLAAHRPSHTTTATPQGVASTDQLGVSSFAPSVMVDGRALTPAGWMWVLSFAMAGCEWAEKDIRKPEFAEKVARWARERRAAEAEQEIAHFEARIAELKSRLTPNVRAKRGQTAAQEMEDGTE